jgi:hypothetical protein
MSSKNQYTPEELKLLLFAPLWVNTLVGMVDGKLDSLEIEALVNEIHHASFWKNDLTREILGTLSKDLDRIFPDYAADLHSVKSGLESVNDLLSKKATADDAAAFKKSLFLLAVRTAMASGEWVKGKWTGVNTSEEESKAIENIASILHIPSEELIEACKSC